MNITKEFTFDSAHQLVGHSSKCKNVHGHTYRVQINFSRENALSAKESQSAEGMVFDFGDVKKGLAPLLDRMDHAFLAQGNEPILSELDTKAVLFGFRTTAENMADFICWYSTEVFSDVDIDSVRLWETPSGSAIATNPDGFYIGGGDKFKDVIFLERGTATKNAPIAMTVQSVIAESRRALDNA